MLHGPPVTVAVGWRAGIERLATLLDEERDRRILWMPVLLGTGVLLYFALSSEPTPWLGVTLAGAAIAGACLAHRRPAVRGVLLAFAAVAAGFAAGQLAAALALPIDPLPTHATQVTGTAHGVEPVPRGRRITLHDVHLDGAGTPLHRPVRIRLKPQDDRPVRSGERIRVRAMLRPAAPPAFPGAWDMQRDAYFSGLGGIGYALGPAEHLGTAPATPMLHILRLQETINQRIAAVLPGSSGALSQALLTGAMSAIAEPDIAAFRDSGLAHLLSVSGVHIAIVMGIGMVALRALLAAWPYAALHWPCKHIAGLVGLACGAFYMVLTGVQVPMVRSFLMAGLVTAAVLVGRRAFSMRSLALAAGLLLLAEPVAIVGASMQMSFFAVMALAAGSETAGPVLRRWHRAGGRMARLGVWVLGFMLTSVLAGGATTPFSAYHFGRVQTYFVLSNLIAVPLTGFWVMPAGMLALLLMPLGLERVPLLLMGWGVDAVLLVARATAALPGAAVLVPHLPGWGLAAFAFGMLWMSLWRTRLRLAGVLAIAVGFAAPALHRPPDLLVSADARLIALRTDNGVFLQQTGGTARFTRDAWLHYFGMPSALALPGEGSAAGGAIDCQREACLLRPRPEARAAVLVRGGIYPGGCRAASVFVSAEPARGLCPRPWPKLVDRFTVWRDGATAIWLEPHHAVVLTDRAARGDRPWVPPRPTPRHQRPPDIPMAASAGE